MGFSGGADSLALLLLLWAHWPERRRRLVAVHFNHRLRGAAAERDEQFGASVCAALGLRWRAGKWTEARRGASEAEAREARHAFFRRELKRARARVLWLGHQQDDIAETMLMRLGRGSGLAGLAAPRPVHEHEDGRVHLRPLLTLKKAELAAALREAGAVWREDATNAAGDFYRNRIRRDVVPRWREAAVKRDALAGAALARELLEEDETALNAWLAEIAPLRADGALNLRRLAGKPRGLVRRALQLWLARAGRAGVISRQAFAALLDDVMKRRVTRHSIGTGLFAELKRDRLTLAGPAAET